MGVFIKQHALNQRSPAEGKGKGQKLLAQGNALGIKAISSTPLKAHRQHALKGQKLLAQGNALGIKAISNTPCKGNSFKTPGKL